MNTAYLKTHDFSFFSEAQEQFEHMLTDLKSPDYSLCDHGQLEQYIHEQGFELLRRMFQGWLDMKAASEFRHSNITAANGIKLTHVKRQTKRTLTSLFGDVIVTRISYNQRRQSSAFPFDEKLNLANDQYSDGLRQRVAKEAVRGAFDNVVEVIDDTTGGHVPKRQCLKLTQDIAQDFESFYQQNAASKIEDTKDTLILTFDGKGIVMRPEGLRDCTKKAAEKSKKLNSRLSPGEKKDRKRMAQVASVYTVKPYIRSAEAIMSKSDDNDKVKTFRPPIRNKRVWASVEREAETVIEEAFQEALHRDPDQKREWVVLIDGHPHQIKLIEKVMTRLEVKAAIVMDFIHVLEYLWKAAWCLFEKGDPEVEEWIAERALKILNGDCSQVAKGIRLSATRRNIINRENIDKCADYLLNNKPRLRYGEALRAGFPIASGVIEGACRHLINDRLDITGARWSLQGAEAILKLRSLKSSNDFEKYWGFHKQQSKIRLYEFSQTSAVT